jgi:hypothetical protein
MMSDAVLDALARSFDNLYRIPIRILKIATDRRRCLCCCDHQEPRFVHRYNTKGYGGVNNNVLIFVIVISFLVYVTNPREGIHSIPSKKPAPVIY